MYFILYFDERIYFLLKVYMYVIIIINFVIVNMLSFYGCKEILRKVLYFFCGKVYFWLEEKNFFRILDKNLFYYGLFL